MSLNVKAVAMVTWAATLTLGSGCAAEDEITDAANEVEAGLLQDQLDAVVDEGARGVLLFVDDPNSDPIELSAGVSSVQAEASYEELTPVAEGGDLGTHGEESCGEWNGDNGSAPGSLSLVRQMESGRQVVLLVSSAGPGENTGAPEANTAINALMKSALCR